MRDHWLATRVGCLLFASATLALSASPSSKASRQELGNVLVVDDPRPLDAALQVFQRRCHCVVTYEDPKWREDQVKDITRLLHHTPGAPPALIPIGYPFSLTLVPELSSETPEQLADSLRALLVAYERTNDPGVFGVLANGDVFHVLPRNRAVMNSTVSLPAGNRPLEEYVLALLAQLQATTGEVIVYGGGPNNLMSRPMTFEAANERAGDVLSRAFQATGRKLSWQLLYDAGWKKYMLNVQIVQ